MERGTEKIEDIDAYLESWNDENSFSDEDADYSDGEGENEESSAEQADEDATEENASNDEGRFAEEAEAENNTETDSETSENVTAPEASEEEKEKAEPPAENESSKNGNQLLEEKLVTELPEIQKEYPDVKSAADIGNLGAYVVLTSMCKMSPAAAYRALNGLPAGNNRKMGEERYQNASKAHLTAAVPKGASGPEGLSRAEVKEYSDILGLDEKEIKSLYNRIKK